MPTIRNQADFRHADRDAMADAVKSVGNNFERTFERTFERATYTFERVSYVFAGTFALTGVAVIASCTWLVRGWLNSR